MTRPEDNETFVASKLNPGALEADLRYSVDGEIRFDAGSRALYATDASNYRQIPIGVVLPRTTEAVLKTLEICRGHGAPVVSRGGGTGLCGQTCNVAVVIDHSKYLNRILDLDPEQRFAWVEPGVILDELREQAERYHLTFGPDPATHTHNTLGGMIGNNSCGVHSVLTGRTVDNVLELDVVTYDGVRMTVGPTTEGELEEIISGGGRRGEIYDGLRDIRDGFAELIRKRYPKIPRRVSGYNLDGLLPENRFNVAQALVGTEGTCVTVLAAKLRLVHSPPHRSLLVLGYPDVFSAGDHVSEIMKFSPAGLEGLDEMLVSFMKKKELHIEDIPLLPKGKGWLLVEFGGETPEEATGNARRTMQALSKAKEPPEMGLFLDPEEAQTIWEIRESGLGATSNVPGMPLAWPGWEDAAIPPERIGEYLREFRTLLEEHGLTAALYGHFGDGCIHCRISFDLFSPEGIANFSAFLEKASDLVVSYGGSFSAEHGDGQSKAIFLRKMYGDELLNAFRRFKALWDPHGKMNPGKVIDPYFPNQNLRLGVDYNPWQPETSFRFPSDRGSFARATLRCVGVGKCRRTHDAFMCPSFVGTREEKHTTRGRAHLLFEMFRGDFIKGRWRSHEVREALEFCLSCKGVQGGVSGPRGHGDLQSGVSLALLPPSPAPARGLLDGSIRHLGQNRREDAGSCQLHHTGAGLGGHRQVGGRHFRKAEHAPFRGRELHLPLSARGGRAGTGAGGGALPRHLQRLFLSGDPAGCPGGAAAFRLQRHRSREIPPGGAPPHRLRHARFRQGPPTEGRRAVEPLCAPGGAGSDAGAQHGRRVPRRTPRIAAGSSGCAACDRSYLLAERVSA